jgi:hypothetical protein
MKGTRRRAREDELRNRKNANNKGKCKKGIIQTRTITAANRKQNRKETNDR